MIRNIWNSVFSRWLKRNHNDEQKPILTSSSLKDENYELSDTFFVNQDVKSQDVPELCPETGIQEPRNPPKGRSSRGFFVPPERRINLLWSNVWVETKVKRRGKICEKLCGRLEEEPKIILKGVSGLAGPGNLIAIMGASGAGKSTLMNVLTEHNLQKLEVRGQVLVTNSINILPSVGEVSTYIQQEDVFVASLTVREHLFLQAHLRMPREGRERKTAKVESIMEQLSLMKCANVRIGNLAGGISVGERKRLSFASQLLSNPPLLFCDEPTSGLDSYMSELLISILRQLALEGHTILCTIHQPSSEVYSMFDRLILMADGRCVYHGDIDKAVQYFSKLGYQCPASYCPADYFIDVVSIKPGQEDACRRRVEALCDAFDCSSEFRVIQACIEEEHFQARSTYEDNSNSQTKSLRASIWQQLCVLIWRCGVDTLRDPSVLKSNLLVSVGFGVFLGVLYWNQLYDQSSAQNINGLLFLIIVEISATTPGRISAVIPTEFPLVKREHRSGMYSIGCYIITRFTIEVLHHVIQSLIIVGIAYYMVGLNGSTQAFMVALGTTALMTTTAVSFGTFFSVISPNSGVALNLMIPMFLLFSIFGGFYMNPRTTPVYFQWVRFISWYPAVYGILQVNQWATIQHLECKLNSTLPCLENGLQVLEKYGYDQDSVVVNVAVVSIMAIVYLLLAVLVIWMRTRKRREKQTKI